MTDALTCPCCGQAVTRAAQDPGRVIDLLPLSPTGRRILHALAGRFGRWTSATQLIDALWSDRADGGPLWARGQINVQLCRMGPVLATSPLAVERMPRRERGFPAKGAYAQRRLVWREKPAAGKPQTGKQR